MTNEQRDKVKSLVKEIIKSKSPKNEMKKMEKSAVLYTYRPETHYTCEQCVFFKKERCALYGPTVDIKPYGGCNLWLHADAEESDIEIPWIGLITKEESGYTENKLGFSCKRCEEFIVGKNDCKKIDKDSEGDTPGEINANACCNRWEADPERAKLPLEKLTKLLEKESK